MRRRTWVEGHNRKKPGGGTTRVKRHAREYDTRGQVKRKNQRRSKQARNRDRATRAKGARPYCFKKNREKWQNDPGSTDIIGVD